MKTNLFRLEYNEEQGRFRRNYGNHTPWENGWATVLSECDLDTYFSFMQWMDNRKPEGTDLFGVLDEWECFAQAFGKRTFVRSRSWTPDKGDYREWMGG